MQRIIELLKPFSAKGVAKVRIGHDFDGGYVMLDDFKGINSVYSFGVGDEVSFDLHMARRGLPVFMFDPTVDGPPISHSRFIFSKLGLWSGNDLERLTHFDVAPLILKIDIEGTEWNVFDNISLDTLRRFRQIVCEFHWFNYIFETAWRKRAERVLTRLTETHCLVHIHGNNFSHVVKGGLPITLEATFAARDAYKFEPSMETFPTPLDRPNRNAPDLPLECFKRIK